MIPGYEKIVEARIRAAQKQGTFEKLPGRGKPLTLTDDRHIAEELRLAHKILKNAGFVPPELELCKEIRKTEDLLAGAEEERNRYRILKKLNFLIMKLNLMRGGSAESEIPQRYEPALTEHLFASDSTSSGQGEMSSCPPASTESAIQGPS